MTATKWTLKSQYISCKKKKLDTNCLVNLPDKIAFLSLAKALILKTL